MKWRPLCWILLLLAALAINGCGGLTTALLTGTVLDIENNPVRGATVRASGKATTTTATGAFQLQGVGHGNIEVTAEVDRNGVMYRGRTVAQTFTNEQTNSVNILVVPEGQRATIHGNVRDRDGFVLEGASVWAYSGVGSAQRAVTDINGDYEMRDLAANIDYTLQANGRTYQNDQAIVVLSAGENRRVDFLLGDADFPGLFPPDNAFAVTWVSPTDLTRAPGEISPYERVRQIFDKDRYVAPEDRVGGKTRAIRDDLIAEVNLFWDGQNFADLFGYGIYRGLGAGGFVSGYDFIGNPTADYYVDIGVNVGTTYSYAVSTLSGNFPDFPNSTESGLSDRVVATMLDRLDLGALSTNPLTFRWLGGSGATQYVVYLFDEFPGVQVDPVWSNEGNPTSSLSYFYDGPSLQNGRRYWYLVLGLSDDISSRTISQIDTFVR